MVKRRATNGAKPTKIPAAEVGVDVDAFVSAYPRLYHMAEAGSWNSIRQYGLLSTEALLDLFEVKGAEREMLLAHRRSAKVAINHDKFGRAVIRDNLPILDAQLAACLYGGLTPSDWFRLLNRKVFFWVSDERLSRLLGAQAYREEKHDILVVDSRSLLRKHLADVTLSPINSGATRPAPTPRGPDTFLPLAQYPFTGWKKKRGSSGEIVVECAIDYAVRDIVEHTLSVEERRYGDRSNIIWTP